MIAEEIADRSGVLSPQQRQRRQELRDDHAAFVRQIEDEIHQKHLAWLEKTREEFRRIEESEAHRKHQEEVRRIEEEINKQFLLHDAAGIVSA